jgi:hypothetical protein
MSISIRVLMGSCGWLGVAGGARDDDTTTATLPPAPSFSMDFDVGALPLLCRIARTWL